MGDARTLLAASLPLLFPDVRPPLFGTQLSAILTSRSAIPSASSGAFTAFTEQQRLLSRRPRPEQRGQRITEEWLFSLLDQDCLWRFRFSADEIVRLADVLQIPEPFSTCSRYSFSRIEALALLCARFRTAGDMYELSLLYARCQSSISECINELVLYIDTTWSHLLDCDREHLLHPSRLAQYANAIYQHGSRLQSIIGFIDCTIRRICRPSQWQCQAYNGHKKFHALKFQAVMLPNGIIGHLFGPFEGRRHDTFLLKESRLLQTLSEFAFREDVPDGSPIEERNFQIFGDPAYGTGPHIISPFSGPGVRTKEEQDWNAQMAAVRIEVEHGFGNISILWPFLNAGWKMHLYSSPVGRYYRVGVILTNALNCIRPNQVSQYFNCPPPCLDEYFIPLDTN